MTPFFPGSVTSDVNEDCTTTSYQIGPNFGGAHDLHCSRGPNSAQWSPLGLNNIEVAQFWKATEQKCIMDLQNTYFDVSVHLAHCVEVEKTFQCLSTDVSYLRLSQRPCHCNM